MGRPSVRSNGKVRPRTGHLVLRPPRSGGLGNLKPARRWNMHRAVGRRSRPNNPPEHSPPITAGIFPRIRASNVAGFHHAYMAHHHDGRAYRHIPITFQDNWLWSFMPQQPRKRPRVSRASIRNGNKIDLPVFTGPANVVRQWGPCICVGANRGPICAPRRKQKKLPPIHCARLSHPVLHEGRRRDHLRLLFDHWPQGHDIRRDAGSPPRSSLRDPYRPTANTISATARMARLPRTEWTSLQLEFFQARLLEGPRHACEGKSPPGPPRSRT